MFIRSGIRKQKELKQERQRKKKMLANRKVDEKYGIELFSKTREEFVNFYNNYLANDIVGLEKERKKFTRKLKSRIVLNIVALIGAGLIWYFLHIFYGVIACLLLIGETYKYVKDNKARIEADIKQQIMPRLVAFMNENFEYSPREHMGAGDFNEANVFERYTNNITGDDFVEGYVYDEVEKEGTGLIFSEIDAKYTYTSKTREGERQENHIDIFKGLLFKVRFNKNFGDSHTIIVPRWLIESKTVVSKIRKPGRDNDLKEVHLEDPEFMEKFVVYSNDQVMSRVILQADTMYKMLNFINQTPETVEGDPIPELSKYDFSPSGLKRAVNMGLHGDPTLFIPYFAFKNRNLYFFYGTGREHFSFSISKELNIDTVFDYFRDINRVLRLIDDLHLNLKIYVN